jgi:hypothetical protein
MARTPGSQAPPGQSYAIRRDTPPGQTEGRPVYLTRPAAVISVGAYTSDQANARRWLNRPAAFRFLHRNQADPARNYAGTLDSKWYVMRIKGSVPPVLHQRRRPRPLHQAPKKGN